MKQTMSESACAQPSAAQDAHAGPERRSGKPDRRRSREDRRNEDRMLDDPAPRRNPDVPDRRKPAP